MKRCPNCQRALADEAKFCMYCGASIGETPAEPVKQFCINCGVEVSGSFCTNCGTPVGPVSPVPLPTAEPSPVPAAEPVPVRNPEEAYFAPTPAPKKKGKGGLIAVIIAVVLVLALAVSWAFGLFGGGLFGEDGIFASESHRDRNDEDEDEDEDEKKAIPIIAKHPTLGEVVEGYMEVDITDERDCVYKWEDGSIHDVPEEPQIQEAQPEEITLTVCAPAEEYDWLAAMADEFSRAHPEYSITYIFEAVHVGDAKNFMLSGGVADVDVYMYANDQLGELVEAGALTELGGSYLERVQNDNSATFVDTVTYTDGGVYGFPYTSNTWFMYYNKAIYTEEDVKSLETMLEKGTVAFPLSNSWYLASFYVANGGTVFGPAGNDAADGIQFGGANGTAVTNYLVDLAANRNFKNDIYGLGLSGLADGSVAAFFSGSWDAQNVAAVLGENMGVAQLPTITINGEIKQLRPFAGSKAIGVNPNSDHPQAAMQLAAFLASEEAQLLHYEMNQVIPAASTLATHPTIAQDAVAVVQSQTMQNTAIVQPIIPEMNNYWGPATIMGEEIVNGAVTHKNAEEKTKEFNEMLNEG